MKEEISRLLGDIKRKVAQILLEIDAVSINIEQPFKYTSGILSPVYIDNRLLISYPEKWGYIIDSFVNVITNIIGLQNFDIIAGMATSGIPHATLVADRLNLPMIYVKFENDKKGQHGSIEGIMKKGDRIVMIEDHITTGKSVLSSVKVLREAGYIVDWCVAIFKYDTKDLELTFDKEKIRLLTLCDLSTLMDIAVELEFIKSEDQSQISPGMEGK